MAQKPTIPKGTRDFLPFEILRRNYIFDTIRGVFQQFSYLPIETPAMENLSVLLGKYGEEGDKLLFKVLNSGDFKPQWSTDLDAQQLSLAICEKGLRYDLTVPFARFVTQHQNEIQFPFKRYQIQPVWRADRPQKGRYREFYQCDVDVIGSRSLTNEAELVKIIETVYNKLKINVVTKINNRKILSGIAEYIGYPDQIIDITIAIDKLEKIGLDKVIEELQSKNIRTDAIQKLTPILLLSGDYDAKIAALKTVLAGSDIAQQGIAEIEQLWRYLRLMQVTMPYELDLSLARGLNYYTGAIFEVKPLDTEMGSICGGGRYDNLTGIFGLKDVSGVGISFGADRIYDVMESLNIFPKETTHCKLMFVNFGETELNFVLPILNTLRYNGIACQLYPDANKLQKQFSYADANQIPFVAMIGETEKQNGTLSLKTMQTGVQETLTVEQLIQKITTHA
ncbi:histidine--tRNA ligase [Bacteroidia bacterium]|nr:histidine--tRNA ligase [Bacteroidia bacterium]